MKSRVKKRIVSIVGIFVGISLFSVAITTNYWWQQATKVSSPKLLKRSLVYMWKGLNSACFHLPPSIPLECKRLEKWHLDDDWTTTVKYLMYVCIAFGGAEVLVVIGVYLWTKQLFMDFISMSSLIIAIIGTIGLSIYTERNPTHLKIFVLYGYSYVCGWLGVCSFLLSTLMAILSRLNENGVSFTVTTDTKTVHANV